MNEQGDNPNELRDICVVALVVAALILAELALECVYAHWGWYGLPPALLAELMLGVVAKEGYEVCTEKFNNEQTGGD